MGSTVEGLMQRTLDEEMDRFAAIFEQKGDA